MAHVLIKKLSNAAHYVGKYLNAYLDKSRAYFVGSLAEELGLNRKPIASVVSSLETGVIPEVGGVQTAGKEGPDASGRSPQRAFDISIGLSKYISVAYVLCAEHRDAIWGAVKQALENMFAVWEERCAVARTGRDGTHIFGNWIPLVIPEFTARGRGDIQIHFHIILYTAIQCKDGVVRALDTRPLYAHVKWAGALLTAELARLFSELGLRAEITPQGKLTIEGIPERLCEEWSSRRREVVAFMESNNLTTPRESDFAALASRTGKHRDEPLDEVLARHEREARRLGYDPIQIEARCFDAGRKHSLSLPRELVTERLDALSKDPRLTRVQDFEFALATDSTRLGIGISEIIAKTRSALRRLGDSLTQIEHELDRRNLTHALEALSKRKGISARGRALDAAAKKHGLSNDQTSALLQIMGRGSRLRVLDCPDAAERYQVLRALRDALFHSGVDCVSATLRKAERESVSAQTGIPTFTVFRALAEMRRAHEPGLFQNRSDVAFRKVRTDPISDTLAWTAGVRSAREIKWRSWMRTRQPLDLKDGPHVFLIEEAQNLRPQPLTELLSEAKRAGATVILSGDRAKSSRFSSLVEKYSGISVRKESWERERRELQEVGRLWRLSEPSPDPNDSNTLRRSIS